MNRRPGSRARAARLLAAALLLCAGKAAAQSTTLQVVPVQGLSFGNLIPGVPEQVGVGDGARRAEVVLQGRGTFDL
ncbi:MAG TPA: hypothetical protein VF705_00505, partial [Longimicrobium sp.]